MFSVNEEVTLAQFRTLQALSSQGPQTVTALAEHYFGAFTRQASYVDLDTGLAAMAAHASSLGYDAVLLSLADLRDEPIPRLVDHARSIASIIPIIGFYLQPSVGGFVLPYEFWRAIEEYAPPTHLSDLPQSPLHPSTVARHRPLRGPPAP